MRSDGVDEGCVAGAGSEAGGQDAAERVHLCLEVGAGLGEHQVDERRGERVAEGVGFRLATSGAVADRRQDDL